LQLLRTKGYVVVIVVVVDMLATFSLRVSMHIEKEEGGV
jgi:hypothetical protein